MINEPGKDKDKDKDLGCVFSFSLSSLGGQTECVLNESLSNQIHTENNFEKGKT